MAEHLASLFGTEKDRVNVSVVAVGRRGGERGRATPPHTLCLCVCVQCPQHTRERERERERTRALTNAPHPTPHSLPLQCPFYFKIGACRHGDRCSRAHNKPSVSPTLLLRNLYENAAAGNASAVTARDATGLPASAASAASSASQADFEAFYEDVFEELALYGRLDALNVCDNVADHLVGAVYAQWADEDAAAAAHADLNGRFYEGRPIAAEFSPVTDFREVRVGWKGGERERERRRRKEERDPPLTHTSSFPSLQATCRQYEERTCTRGGYCNFMHLRPVSRSLRRRLFGRYVDDDRRDDGRRSTRDRRSRSRSRERGRGREREVEAPRRRESSAERRAKIAAWNAEAAAGGV